MKYKHLSQNEKAVKYHKMAIEIFNQVGKDADYYKQHQLKNWEALNNFEGKGLYQSEKTRSNFEVRFNVDYQIEKTKVDVNMLKQAFVPPQPSFD